MVIVFSWADLIKFSYTNGVLSLEWKKTHFTLNYNLKGNEDKNKDRGIKINDLFSISLTTQLGAI